MGDMQSQDKSPAGTLHRLKCKAGPTREPIWLATTSGERRHFIANASASDTGGKYGNAKATRNRSAPLLVNAQEVEVTADEVKKEFEYVNGVLMRRATGKSGYVRPDGYRYTRLNGRSYGEHRLVYLLYHGFMPVQVDHINGDRTDNRIENLRAVTNAQNCMNRKGSAKGCYFNTKRDKWVAQIGVAGKRKTLGYFQNQDDAKAAYAKASKELHGEFGRAE